jgi:hypothetical protein
MYFPKNQWWFICSSQYNVLVVHTFVLSPTDPINVAEEYFPFGTPMYDLFGRHHSDSLHSFKYEPFGTLYSGKLNSSIYDSLGTPDSGGLHNSM